MGPLTFAIPSFLPESRVMKSFQSYPLSFVKLSWEKTAANKHKAATQKG